LTGKVLFFGAAARQGGRGRYIKRVIEEWCTVFGEWMQSIGGVIGGLIALLLHGELERFF